MRGCSMKKTVIAWILMIALLAGLLAVPAAAHTPEQQKKADALFSLQLFKGMEDGYHLDDQLTREQGVVLLLRLLGKEKEAEASQTDHPFTDLNGWSTPYVAYAYGQGFVKGMTDTTFGGSREMSDIMFMTISLRALGYTDQNAEDFTYAGARSFAKNLHLVADETTHAEFTRGEAVEFFWEVLSAFLKGKNQTLAQSLVAAKVFTQAEFDAAKAIAAGTPATAAGGTGSVMPAAPSHKTLTWEEYIALDADGQFAYYKSFSDPADFFAWNTKAQEEYKAAHPNIGTNGVIDIEELQGKG